MIEDVTEQEPVEDDFFQGSVPENLPSVLQQTSYALQMVSKAQLGPTVVVQNNKLALDFKVGDQIIDPLAEKSHSDVIKYTKRLVERVPRLRNTHKDLADDTDALWSRVNLPFAEVPKFDVEIWNLSNALAEHLQEDSLKIVNKDSNTPALDPEDRRTLEAVLTRVGVWTRFFPNSRRLDDEYRAYHSKPQTLDAVQAVLTSQGERLVFLEEKTKSLLLLALRTAHGSTQQAPKAQGLATEGAKSIAGRGLFLSRRGFLKAATAGLTVGVTKKIGEDVADELDLGNTVGEWLKKHAPDIRKLFEDEPPDLKGAVDQLLDVEAPDLFTDDDNPLDI